MFSTYAAIVKNLRGVVLLELGEKGVDKSLDWLIKRFRYRNLGLAPIIAEKYRDRIKKYLAGNPFRELAYPIASIKEFRGKLAEKLELSEEVLETLVFSSIYVSPVIMIGDTYLDELMEISINTVNTCRELNTNEWKLHLRIADYSVLDMYEWSIENARYVVSSLKTNKDFTNALVERYRRIEKDRKRYWRIMCNEGRQVFVLYIDMLKLVMNREPGLLKDIDDDCLAIMGIISVVRVPPGISG
ncbi:MAG: hypothetical protein QW249_06320 [Desulfurococcaceae archaeon]